MQWANNGLPNPNPTTYPPRLNKQPVNQPTTTPVNNVRTLPSSKFWDEETSMMGSNKIESLQNRTWRKFVEMLSFEAHCEHIFEHNSEMFWGETQTPKV